MLYDRCGFGQGLADQARSPGDGAAAAAGDGTDLSHCLCPDCSSKRPRAVSMAIVRQRLAGRLSAVVAAEDRRSPMHRPRRKAPTTCLGAPAAAGPGSCHCLHECLRMYINHRLDVIPVHEYFPKSRLLFLLSQIVIIVEHCVHE